MFNIPILAQTDLGEAASTAASGATGIIETTKEITLWEMIQAGGWYIMVPMAIMSVLLIYISIERFLAINKAARGENSFMQKVKEYIHEGKIDAARNLCATTDNPYARMVEKGITKIGKPLKDIEASIENVGKVEVSKLEKGVSLLATIAGAAPMIGFLGTVIGMIMTFNEMRIDGQVEIQALSGGIMMAMVTTVAGLILGIFSYIMYNMLVAKVGDVISKMETTSLEFLDLLDEPGK
ncbi:MAG TPA: MotA/TolQ/ExbB proton channel family protein [Flavobacteriales bacterium]|nr:biopolymer transporter ExbB [Flavobacteriales bacterium]HRE75214.1 MotA/TolQ/ExbB proton channel family protein [Flavobacteriales bacterium]HRE97865.1 MotA/TolQ/ExbB proton channel family protein [Flavobacteriales bacterium]HRJ36027.1 MotA/TolQ/ExbB proton channel family protein [Flavobacteriales bacterium]HRJ39273.1 MotA/TolQ/ExbB proton channel family protein [Flavobacteriales bacterium]